MHGMFEAGFEAHQGVEDDGVELPMLFRCEVYSGGGGGGE